MKRGDKIKVWKRLFDESRRTWREATVLRGPKNRTKPGWTYLQMKLDRGEYAEFWVDAEELQDMQEKW